MRPSTPPASLTRLNAVSIPSFIWRPSSRAEPAKGAAKPKRISRSVMPRPTGGGKVAPGAGPGVVAARDGAGVEAVDGGAAGAGPGATGAAFAGAGPITADRLGPAT